MVAHGPAPGANANAIALSNFSGGSVVEVAKRAYAPELNHSGPIGSGVLSIEHDVTAAAVNHFQPASTLYVEDDAVRNLK